MKKREQKGIYEKEYYKKIIENQMRRNVYKLLKITYFNMFPIDVCGRQ